MDFKPGDRVICLVSSKYHPIPKAGKIYTIKEITGSGMIILQDDTWWESSRFILATPLTEALI